MALKLGSLYLLISGKSDALKAELNKAQGLVRTSATKMTAVMQKAGKAMFSLPGLLIGGGIFYGLQRGIRGVISAAEEQENVEKRLGAVLKSTGEAAGFNLEQMKAMASGMQEVTTTGDEVIISGQAMLATFKQIQGQAFERTMMSALDLSEVMQQDLRSSIVMLGKALNDPVANLGALSRAGIQFTKDQKDLIKGLWEAGQTAEAQDLILQELESQFGGAAKAAKNTFGGALKSLGNTIGDIGEQIGFALMPPIFDIVKGMQEWIKENEKLVSQDIPLVFGKMAVAAGKVVDVVGNIISAFAKMTPAGEIQERIDKITQSIEEISKSRAPGRERMLKSLEDALQRNQIKLYSLGQTWDETTQKTLVAERQLMELIGAFDETEERSLINAREKAAELKRIQDEKLSQLEREKELKKELAAATEHLFQRDIDRAEIWDVETRHAEEVEGVYDKMEAKVIEYSDVVKEQTNLIKESWDATVGSMEDAVVTFVTTSKLSFKSLVDSMLGDLVRMMTHKAFQTLGGMLFDVGGVFGVGSPAMGGMYEPVGAGNIGGVMQHGGYIGERVRGVGMSTGGSYEFHPDEFVIPRNKLGSGGGGGRTQVVINNYTDINPQVRDSDINGMKRIEITLANTVMNGGPIAKGMEMRYGLAPIGRSR